jgi:hypothetical protein
MYSFDTLGRIFIIGRNFFPSSLRGAEIPRSRSEQAPQSRSSWRGRDCHAMTKKGGARNDAEGYYPMLQTRYKVLPMYLSLRISQIDIIYRKFSPRPYPG